MYEYLTHHSPIDIKRVTDKVYNDCLGYANGIFTRTKASFYEELKLSLNIEEFLNRKRQDYCNRLVDTGLVGDIKSTSLKSQESVYEQIHKMGYSLPYPPNHEVTFSFGEIDKPTFGKILTLPNTYNYLDEYPLFENFAKYITYQYLISFIDNAIEIYQVSKDRDIKGKDFSVVLYFDNDCKEIVRNIDEYDNVYENLNTTPEANRKTKEVKSIQSILISNIEKIAELANKRIKHLDNLGFANILFPSRTILKDQIRNRNEFDELVNLKELLQYRFFLDEVGNIKPLDVESLAHSDKLSDYYERNYKFVKIKNSKNGTIESCIIESASFFIEKQEYQYPWNKFSKGFQDEYVIKKELPTEELKTWELRYIQPKPTLPDRTQALAAANAYKYGVKMAKAYKAWEHVIEDLPTFERLLFSSHPNTKELSKNKDNQQSLIVEEVSLNNEVLTDVIDILKVYFSSEDFELLQMLLSGNSNSEKKLVFKDSGNRLTDTFKKLFENQLIIDCTTKKQLEHWIIKNFKYTYRKEIKEYSPDYTEKCISRDEYPCKAPIIEIINGRIQKTNVLRKRQTRTNY